MCRSIHLGINGIGMRGCRGCGALTLYARIFL